MRLLKAIGGFFTAILNIVTFGIIDLRKWLISSPTGIKAEYTAIIDEKRKRANSLKDAVSQLVANNEKKKARLEELSNDCEILQKKKAVALSKAKARLASLGNNQETAKNDAEYNKHKSAFMDFDSTLKEKEQHCEELEADIEGAEKQISNFELQVRSLSRDLQKLQDEKSLTVAEVQAAREAKAATDAFNGLSEDNTSDRLESLRDMRRKAKADVKVSERVSGMDAASDDEEYLSAAAGIEAASEFDQLLGIASGTEQTETTEEPTRVATELPK